MAATKAEFGPYGCEHCGLKAHEHDKERVFPEDGPPGSWHWEYYCP